MSELLRATLATALAIALARAQESRPDTAIDVAFARLTRELEPASPGQRPSLAVQAEKLAAFVERQGAKAGPDPSPVLRARVRLALVLLHRFEPVEAERHFAIVIRDAPREDADVRGAALYGQALALELTGDLARAQTTLEQLQKEHAGTRYGGYARVALARVRAPLRGARAGRLAPAFGPVLDLQGNGHDLATLAGKPALLVFWSPESQASIDRLESLREAWLRAGMPRSQMLAFGVHPERATIADLAQERRLAVPVVPCTQEFVDPVVLAFGVDAVPEMLLLAADGTVLARGLVPARLAEALVELTRR